MHPEPPSEPPGWNTWSATPAASAADADTTPPPAAPTKSKKPLVIALVVVGVLVAAVGAGVVLLGGGDDETATYLDHAGEVPRGARTFTDPDGEYTIAVNPHWQTSTEDTTEFWFTDPTKKTGENFNVSTERFDGDAHAYLRHQLDLLPQQVKNLDIKSSDLVAAQDGTPIVVVELTGSFGDSEERLGGFSAAVVKDSTVALATFVVPIDTYDARKSAIAPYLLTLQRT